MRPYKNLRTGSGYCCEHCDGPYTKWKKANKRHLKRKDKNIDKRQVEKEIKVYHPIRHVSK